MLRPMPCQDNKYRSSKSLLFRPPISVCQSFGAGRDKEDATVMPRVINNYRSFNCFRHMLQVQCAKSLCAHELAA